MIPIIIACLSIIFLSKFSFLLECDIFFAYFLNILYSKILLGKFIKVLHNIHFYLITFHLIFRCDNLIILFHSVNSQYHQECLSENSDGADYQAANQGIFVIKSEKVNSQHVATEEAQEHHCDESEAVCQDKLEF